MIKDEPNLLERVVGLLTENGIPYCVIGGQAVSAFVEPVISLDLDFVVPKEEFERVESLMVNAFNIRRYRPWLSVSMGGSDFRVQFLTDPELEKFIARATSRQVLGMILPVASLADVFHSKVWAAQDPARRASKRQKDLADIARLLEVYPHFREELPEDIRARLY